MRELKEIYEVLMQFIDMSSLVPTYFKPSTKENYEEFCTELKEAVRPNSLSLHLKTGIPYNKHIMSELKNNASVLYKRNAKSRASGYSHLIGRIDVVRLITEGYGWHIYCKENGVNQSS